MGGDSGLANGQYAGDFKKSVQKEIGSSSGNNDEESILIIASGMSYARKAAKQLGDGALDERAALRFVKKSLGAARETMPFAHQSHHEDVGGTIHSGRRGGAAGVSTNVDVAIFSNRAGNSEALRHL